MTNTVRTRWSLADAARVFAAVIATPLAASAQDSDKVPELSPVIVVGTRLPGSGADIANSVTIIGRQDIERMNAGSGTDLFRQVPGLQVDQLGGPGGASFAYIRGSDPNHVLVLVDGIRVNDSTNSRGGGFDLSGLDPAQIERIEVLRGTASAIYGADAIGGVISITTRSGAPGRASVGGGGRGYASIGAHGSLRVDGIAASVTVSRLEDGRDTSGGAMDMTQVSVVSRWAMTRQLQLDVVLRHAERTSSAFPDDSGGAALAVRRELEQRATRSSAAGARARAKLGFADVNLSATHYENRESIDSPGVAPGVRSAIGLPAFQSRTDYRRDDFMVHGTFRVAGCCDVAAGVEAQGERGSNSTTYALFGAKIPATFNLERDTRSAFLEIKQRFVQHMVVTGAVRHDRVDGIGSRTSPSAGAALDIPRLEGTIKADYASGFRAPSFFALGLPVALGGNPNLRPETSRGGSVGYEQRFGDAASASVALFRTRYRDLVTFDNLANRLVNANSVDIRGWELGWQARPVAALRIAGHYTRLLAHADNSDEPVRQRPGHRGGATAIWSLDERSDLQWRIEYVADVFDSAIPTGGVMLPTYLRNDLSYTTHWRPWLNTTLAVDNAFDRTNAAYVGNPGQGRRLRVTLSSSF